MISVGAFLSFDQTQAGQVKATYDIVTASVASGSLLAFVFASLLLLSSIAYAFVERKAYLSIVAASKSAIRVQQKPCMLEKGW